MMNYANKAVLFEVRCGGAGFRAAARPDESRWSLHRTWRGTALHAWLSSATVWTV
uniref:Uncharacterized protein n=1 Tax=Anguilla anguilla TaxID=7936 RepID=A0A0E9SLR1_ANGAN